MPHTGQFDLPSTPDDTTFPETPQIVATSVMGVLVLAFVGYAIHEIVKHRSYTLALLLLGGAVSYFNEPIDDVLGLVYHPPDGQWTVLDTFAPVPLWGLGIYIVFFGGMPYVVLRALQNGLTRRQLWEWVGILFALDIAVELPILHYGLYDYYGDPPFEVAGFPLYWLFINIGAPFEVAVVLLVVGRFFTGTRITYLVLLPMSCDAAGSVAVGWPVFSALNAQADTAVTWAAAILTMLIGFVLLDLTIRYAADHCSPSDQDRPPRTSSVWTRGPATPRGVG